MSKDLESNSFILGKIGGNNNCISKTYLESSFAIVGPDYFSKIIDENEKLYLDNNNEIRKGKTPQEGWKEVEIISVMPYYTFDNIYNRTYTNLLIEYIDKKVLLRHLQDERRLVEEFRNNMINLDGEEVLC